MTPRTMAELDARVAEMPCAVDPNPVRSRYCLIREPHNVRLEKEIALFWAALCGYLSRPGTLYWHTKPTRTADGITCRVLKE